MFKLNKAIKLILIYVLTSWLWSAKGVAGALSDLRLCADPKCEGIISIGTAKINYNPGEKGMVAFRINSIIRIKSKSAGKNMELWGIEVNGRRGYAPKEFIKETKIIVSDANLKYIVPVIQSDTIKESVQPADLDKTSSESDSTVPLQIAEETKILTSIDSVNTVSQSELPSPVQKATQVDHAIEMLEKDVKLKSSESPYVETLLDNDSNQKDKQTDKVVNIFDEQTIKNETTDSLNAVTRKESNQDKENEVKLNPLENFQIQEQSQKGSQHETTSSIQSKTTKNISFLERPGTEAIEIKENKLKNKVNQHDLENSKTEQQNEIHLDQNSNDSSTISNSTISDINVTEISQAPLVSNENIPSEIDSSTPAQVEVVSDSAIEMHAELHQQETANSSLIDKNNTTESKEENNLIEGTEKVQVELIKTVENASTEKNIANVSNGESEFHKVALNKIELSVENSMSLNNESKTNQISVEKGTNESNFSDNVTPNPINNELSAIANEAATELPDITEPGFSHFHDPYVLESTTAASVQQKENANVPVMENIQNEEDPVDEKVEPIEEDDDDEEEISEEDVEPIEKEKDRSGEVIVEQSTQASNQPPVFEKNRQHDFQQNHTPRLAEPVEYETNTQPSELKPNIENDAVKPETKSSSHNDSPLPSLAGDTVNPNLLKPIVEEISKHDSHPNHVFPEMQTEENKSEGLFIKIADVVNSFWANDKKEMVLDSVADNHNDELQRILFSDRVETNNDFKRSQYCASNSRAAECPSSIREPFTLNNFIETLAEKVLELKYFLACIVVSGTFSLLFAFGYYFFCNSSREGALLARLNLLERSLIAAHKENETYKHDLIETRKKLASIEDNSFGSNDMVAALRKQLDERILEKEQLAKQVISLEKELEHAAEAGLELNKIVSELIVNQSGADSIITSVEDLQKQLNEQKNTIAEINAHLAEKSRQNSELQVRLIEQEERLNSEIASLRQDNDELEAEKSQLKTRLEYQRNEFEEDLSRALEGKNFEIRRLQAEIIELRNKNEKEHNKWQTSMAKIEALEECLATVKRDPNVKISEVIEVANVRAELLALQKQFNSLKERFEMESDARQLAENQHRIASADVERLKQEFHQSEKDKLEAQTRLEVLSNYFKEKETQLQKELSLKEAIWLKQQGEKTSTVDRLTQMQEEIQNLKSQNDALRAEIDAQLAAHKAQTGTLENRAHETWLAARQSDRRYEEARTEATALRRKLTAMLDMKEPNQMLNDGKIGTEMNNTSPLHMESPSSPMLGRLPPPPPFLPPPPFMGPPPPPFLGIPSQFVAHGKMRPAPLGRIMSPPPVGGVHSGLYSSDERHRYARDDFDYDDDEDDDEIGNDGEEDYRSDDEELTRRRRRNDDDNWRRHQGYSPVPRSYRSHSPSDSRLNNTKERDIMSTYDTETDYSPSPSPRERRRGDYGKSNYNAYASQPPKASTPLSDDESSRKPRPGLRYTNKANK